MKFWDRLKTALAAFWGAWSDEPLDSPDFPGDAVAPPSRPPKGVSRAGTTGGVHNTNIVTVTTTATLLVPNRLGRLGVIVQNTGADTVYIGPADVTASGARKGYTLAGGLAPAAEFIDTKTAGPLYAIAASGSNEVFVDEIF